MAASTPDRDTPLTETQAYYALKFLKLLLTVVTLVLAIHKGLGSILT